MNSMLHCGPICRRMLETMSSRLIVKIIKNVVFILLGNLPINPRIIFQYKDGKDKKVSLF